VYVYPNPCGEVVHLQPNLSPGEVMSVKLLGTQGDQIAEIELTSIFTTVAFNLSEEPEGQLYFEIEYQGELYREKVLKIN
jgi:hypothetical protein